MDFIVQKYSLLLEAVKRNGFTTTTFYDFLQEEKQGKTLILRHDVDRTPANSLKTAQIEHDMGLQACYYFRTHAGIFNEEIIAKIKALGHEIGYHYENLSDSHGDFDLAIKDFSENLEKFRKITEIKTMCMHGSPLSKFNNQELWRKYDFKDFGICGEPYFSLDFNHIGYITDAGRKWNDEKVNFRDKVNTSMHFDISHTDDIISMLDSGKLPNQLMINIHPHNWAFSSAEWYKTYLWQGFKNTIKAILHTLDKRD